jgi:hypothetical protein
VDGSKLVHLVDYSRPLKDILMAFGQKKSMHVLFKFNQRNLSTLCVFAKATSTSAAARHVPCERACVCVLAD